MHIGMKRRFLKNPAGEGERSLELELGLGLAPEPVQVLPAVTREELEEAGIPFWRVDPILAQLGRWAARNPEKNQKELLLALAKGYNRTL